jgi:hypothetical protein
MGKPRQLKELRRILRLRYKDFMDFVRDFTLSNRIRIALRIIFKRF